MEASMIAYDPVCTCVWHEAAESECVSMYAFILVRSPRAHHVSSFIKFSNLMTKIIGCWGETPSRLSKTSEFLIIWNVVILARCSVSWTHPGLFLSSSTLRHLFRHWSLWLRVIWPGYERWCSVQSQWLFPRCALPLLFLWFPPSFKAEFSLVTHSECLDSVLMSVWKMLWAKRKWPRDQKYKFKGQLVPCFSFSLNVFYSSIINKTFQETNGYFHYQLICQSFSSLMA